MSHSLKYKQFNPRFFSERLLQILGFKDCSNVLFKNSSYLFSHLIPEPRVFVFSMNAINCVKLLDAVKVYLICMMGFSYSIMDFVQS